MCTVTIIPTGAAGAKEQGGRRARGIRLVTSRDESRDRVPGEPPQSVEFGQGVRALLPIDPAGGGTWVAANDARVVFAILNGNPRPFPVLAPDISSRGSIIPSLIESRTVEEAAALLDSFDLGRFAPFRLLIADLETVRLASWRLPRAAPAAAAKQGERLQWSLYPVAPLCLASSGLGDDRVLPRLELFDQWMARNGVTPHSQNAFHGHAWPERREISVNMSRADARTVSVTTVELSEAFGVQMRYRDDDGELVTELPGTSVIASSSA